MHELPITENIRDIALKHASRAGAVKITDIHLVIGELSSVIDESVLFYWGIVCEGTIAADAELHFRRIPARFQCLDCKTEYTLREKSQICPQCDGVHVKILAGDEFYMDAIDVETNTNGH